MTEAWLGVNQALMAFGASWDLDSPLSRARTEVSRAAVDLLTDLVTPTPRVEERPAAAP